MFFSSGFNSGFLHDGYLPIVASKVVYAEVVDPIEEQDKYEPFILKRAIKIYERALMKEVRSRHSRASTPCNEVNLNYRSPLGYIRTTNKNVITIRFTVQKAQIPDCKRKADDYGWIDIAISCKAIAWFLEKGKFLKTQGRNRCQLLATCGNPYCMKIAKDHLVATAFDPYSQGAVCRYKNQTLNFHTRYFGEVITVEAVEVE